MKEKAGGKGTTAALAGTETEQDQARERVSNAVWRTRPPSPGSQDSQRSGPTRK